MFTLVRYQRRGLQKFNQQTFGEVHMFTFFATYIALMLPGIAGVTILGVVVTDIVSDLVSK